MLLLKPNAMRYRGARRFHSSLRLQHETRTESEYARHALFGVRCILSDTFLRLLAMGIKPLLHCIAFALVCY